MILPGAIIGAGPQDTAQIACELSVNVERQAAGGGGRPGPGATT
jgi:hypothetical protein